MIFYLIGAIVTIIIIVSEKSEKKSEKELLRKRIAELERELNLYRSKYGSIDYENNVSNNTSNNTFKNRVQTYQNNVQTSQVNSNEINQNQFNNNQYKNYYSENQNDYVRVDNTVHTQKVEVDEESVKNKFILMAGAVLIVLAAIVFLTSTWHTIPDVLKTIVIVLLAGVFMGASRIADKVFKLKETANTFLYIALAYLPIAIFSISLFGLLGKYLSIKGEGKFLYFTISSGFLAILYFALGNKRKQNLLINSSMIMQFLTVVFLANCINSKISTVFLALIIYNLILTLIKNNYLKEYLKTIDAYNYIYLYGIFIIQFIILNTSNAFINIITNLLIVFSFYINYVQNHNYVNIISILTSTLLLSMSIFNIDNNIFNIDIKEVLTYIVLLAMFANGVLSDKKDWKECSILVSSLAMIVMYLNVLSLYKENLIIKSYMIMWTITIFIIISYIRLVRRRKIFIHLIPISIYLAQLNTVIENNLKLNILLYTSLALFVFAALNIIKGKKNRIVLQTYSNAMIIVSSISCMLFDYNGFINDILLMICLLATYSVGFIINRKTVIYKIISYLLTNLLICSIMSKLNSIENVKYIPFITTVGIMILEYNYKKLQDRSSEIYLLGSSIISFIMLNIDINLLSFILIILQGIIFIYYVTERKLNSYLKTIPFFAIIPTVYISKWAIMYNMNYMIFANFILIMITTVISLREEKINPYTLISALYIVMQIFAFKFNIYINLTIVLMWTLLHLLDMPKEKMIFETMLYIIGLIYYNNILGDICSTNRELAKITAFKYVGYIVVTMLISRNVVKKVLVDAYKILEYFAFPIIYLIAIFNYTNETDGMIFVLMLVIITIVSYTFKFGPIFISTITAIIINSLLLTREFWFSIPWWVYMLVIGTILIIFAVNNELTENKQKDQIKKKLITFKEYIDM